MRHRQTQFFAAAGNSISFAKRNESWRIVTLTANMLSANATTSQALLTVQDGAGNLIMGFATPAISFGNNSWNITFATVSNGIPPIGGAFSTPPAGGQLNVEIPGDLWIQPQWTVVLLFSPNDASDAITQVVLQSETFTSAKKVAKPAEDGEEVPS
jgi:hypothetical protein